MKICLFVCLLLEVEGRVHPVAEHPASLGYFFLTNVTFFLYYVGKAFAFGTETSSGLSPPATYITSSRTEG